MPLAGLAAGLLMTLFVLTVSACGGNDDEPVDKRAIGEADVIVIAQDVDFDRDRYEVAAGQATVAYIQEGETRHTLLIENSDGNNVLGFKLAVRDPDSSDLGATELVPGTYVFYCDVTGHRSAGMEAELVVR
jgi:plastocyanin